MGNILAFFSTYYRFFLFLVLELICMFLVVKFNEGQRSAFFSWAYDVSGSAYSAYNDVNVYFHLSRVNDSLLAENARLRSQLATSKYIDTARQVSVNDTVFRQRYEYLPATVVNNSVNVPNNYLTVAAGTKKGVKPHSGVMSTAGIVGITRYISSNFSVVLSVLHTDFRVSARIAELNEIGSIIWDGKDPDHVLLKDIPQHVELKKGMHVVTSPYTEVFPEGIMIGTITGFEVKPGDAVYTIQVKLSANIRNVQEVYIVNNLMREEQEQLEKKKEE